MNTGLPGKSYPSSTRRRYLTFVGVSSVLSRASNAARLGSDGLERDCKEEGADSGEYLVVVSHEDDDVDNVM